ncbi:MAG TPA: lysine--tRNA ligase, partial [Gemmatimonadaceae bacterium]|nr:lysine--tRNA ligase [Gemmatimonadaceae bacterium]
REFTRIVAATRLAHGHRWIFDRIRGMEETREGTGGLGDERVVADRVAKLERLRERGVEPYAYRFEPTHAATDALALYAPWETAKGDSEAEGPDDVIRVAGRLVSRRTMGKSTFAHLADRTGRIQLYFRVNDLGDDYGLLDLVDLGDWIGAEGTLFRTKSGEVSLRVRTFQLLAKSLRPLPLGKEETDPETGEKRVHSGFTDVQARYRQRYADLAVHPEVREVFVFRARVVTALRRFLDERGFIEVETPVLQPVYGGAAARPFVTTHNALGMQLYLRIADELYLKRLVVGGLERVYEIGHDFRNEGIDRTHNPEFTMLEFYQAYVDYTGMMTLVEELLEKAADAVRGIPEVADNVPRFARPFRRIEWVPSLNDAAETNVLALDDVSLRLLAQRVGVEKPETLSRPKVLDEMFQALVESKLREPTFVVDYPLELSPLAKPKRGNPELTERFELFANGKEMANAFSELNDPIDQRERFEAQAKLRAAGDLEAAGVDEDYLRAMEYGMPPMGGCGIGIDRLFMYLSGTTNIRDVILFPTMRPE